MIISNESQTLYRLQCTRRMLEILSGKNVEYVNISFQHWSWQDEELTGKFSFQAFRVHHRAWLENETKRTFGLFWSITEEKRNERTSKYDISWCHSNPLKGWRGCYKVSNCCLSPRVFTHIDVCISSYYRIWSSCLQGTIFFLYFSFTKFTQRASSKATRQGWQGWNCHFSSTLFVEILANFSNIEILQLYSLSRLLKQNSLSLCYFIKIALKVCRSVVRKWHKKLPSWIRV